MERRCFWVKVAKTGKFSGTKITMTPIKLETSQLRKLSCQSLFKSRSKTTVTKTKAFWKSHSLSNPTLAQFLRGKWHPTLYGCKFIHWLRTKDWFLLRNVVSLSIVRLELHFRMFSTFYTLLTFNTHPYGVRNHVQSLKLLHQLF